MAEARGLGGAEEDCAAAPCAKPEPPHVLPLQAQPDQILPLIRCRRHVAAKTGARLAGPESQTLKHIFLFDFKDSKKVLPT